MGDKIMRKIRLFVITLATMCFIGCGTPSSISQTLTTNNDTLVEITLNPSKDYTITGTENFAIIKGGNTVAKGETVDVNNFDTYRKTVKETDILSSGTKDGNDYLAWKDENGYTAAIKLRNTDTCILLTDEISEDSLREIMEIMKIQEK